LASYLLRAGSLISSFLATVPIWKGFDPVAILVRPKKKRKKDKNTEPDNIPHPFADKVETMFTEKENQ